MKEAWFDFCRCSETAPFRMWIDVEIWTSCLPACLPAGIELPLQGSNDGALLYRDRAGGGRRGVPPLAAEIPAGPLSRGSG